MHAITKFSRRTFLVFLTEFVAVFLGIFGFRSSTKRATSGTYAGTPYIGKTRENQFKKFTSTTGNHFSEWTEKGGLCEFTDYVKIRNHFP
jgi:hypothetical protein